MAKPGLTGKSLMLVPICDGDPVAAAILDYVYLYFQQPNPYKIFFRELQRGYKHIIDDDSYQYIRESHTPFNLNIEDYPNAWLLTSLTELRAAIGGQSTLGTSFSTNDILAGLRILGDKRYMSTEYWGLSEEEIEDCLQTEHDDRVDTQISCWLYDERVDYAVAKYYNDHLAMPPIDNRIDVRKEKRIVSNQVHRARRIGQAASLTFEEWAETLSYFNLRCAFCQTEPYEVLEHFIPIIHGGPSSVFNCVPSCETCNAIKNDRLPHEFAQDIGEDRVYAIQQYLERRKQRWLEKRQQN